MFYFEHFLQSAPHLVVPLRDLYFPPDHYIHYMHDKKLKNELQEHIALWHANRLITSKERDYLIECLPL